MKGCGREERGRRRLSDKWRESSSCFHSLLVVGEVLDDVLADLRVGVNIEEWNAEVNVKYGPFLRKGEINGIKVEGLKGFCNQERFGRLKSLLNFLKKA